jgi:hypothetical protein
MRLKLLNGNNLLIDKEGTMTNIKKREFYNVITGELNDGKYYGIEAEIFKKVDNVEMIFDSRGSYLGIRTSRGKFENGRYTFKKGPYDFKSFFDLMIWGGKLCSKADFIETQNGQFLQIDLAKQS